MTPIVPITLEQSPPSDFGPDYDFWFLSRLRRAIVSGDVDKLFGGSIPPWFTRRLALSYSNIWGIFTGVATDIFGEPLQSLNGAGSELGGVDFGSV